MKRLLVLALFGVAALTPTALAGSRIALAVSPHFAFAPATVEVTATIASDPDNRSVQIVAESRAYYRKSQIPLDGAEAPRTTHLVLRGLPGGTYKVTATLVDAMGRQIPVYRSLRIVDKGR
jgi:hypothetical protein